MGILLDKAKELQAREVSNEIRDDLKRLKQDGFLLGTVESAIREIGVENKEAVLKLAQKIWLE